MGHPTMRHLTILLVLAVSAITGCGTPPESVPATGVASVSQWFGPGHVALDRATIDRLGLHDSVLIAVKERPRLVVDATIADPLALAALNRQLADAQAASAAQEPGAGELWRETSERMSDGWGDWVSRMSDTGRAELVEDLRAGRRAFVEIPMPRGTQVEDPLDTPVELDARRVAIPVQAWESLSRSRANDAPTLLALVDVPGRPLLAGDAVRAFVATGPPARDGVRLPRAAVFEQGASTWAWVAAGDRRYERRDVHGEPIPGGVFVTDRFRAGERVVVRGVRELEAFVPTLHR